MVGYLVIMRHCGDIVFVSLDKLDDAWVDVQVAADAKTVIGGFNDYFVET